MTSVPEGYTLEELQEDARRYWGSAPLLTVEQFRSLAQRLANQIVEQLSAGNYEAARALMFVAAEGRSYAQIEPLLGEQEQWELKNLLSIAGSAVGVGEFEQSISSAMLALKILDERVERQRRLGLEVRPCTEVRLAALGLLAASIWERPLPEDQLPIQPARLADNYEAIHRRVMWFIRHKLTRDGRGKRQATLYVEQLAYYGLKICKALARYAPGKLPWVIAKYNEVQGATLAAEPWHFKLYRPLRPDSWYYWDFEIAKIWIAGQLNTPDFSYLEEERLRAVRTTRMSERSLQGHLNLWSRQHSAAPIQSQRRSGSPVGVMSA